MIMKILMWEPCEPTAKSKIDFWYRKLITEYGAQYLKICCGFGYRCKSPACFYTVNRKC